MEMMTRMTENIYQKLLATGKEKLAEMYFGLQRFDIRGGEKTEVFFK